MSLLWLSDAELLEATHRARPTAQARALQRMGVPFQKRPDGSLLVSRTALEAALSGSAIVRPNAPANGLNWSKRA
jgi:hypothetical protein